MSEPFLGQVEIFAFGFPPRYWSTCGGQLIGVNQNLALFQLLGTVYGGNGTTTFGLPDLRGRLPMGYTGLGGEYPLGTKSGSEGVALQGPEAPGSHFHPPLTASDNPDTSNNTTTPAGNLGLGVTTGIDNKGTAMVVNIYVQDPEPGATLAPTAVSPAGGQPHENRMPSLALNFCISLFGTFPPKN